MALTFTKRIAMNMDISGKLFRAYEVTHDGSAATANANCDLTTSYGAAIAFTALSAGCTTNFWLIGY